jgi:hypothetical protein
MRSWSEHPCHGTWVVLYATNAQNRLAGNASRSVQSRIASASIRNMIRPRNASIDVTRVVGAAAIVGETTRGGATVTVLMVDGILRPRQVDSSTVSKAVTRLRSGCYATAPNVLLEHIHDVGRTP